MRGGADFADRIEGAGIDVAGLDAHQRGPAEPRQGPSAHAALSIHRHAHHALAPKAGQAQRLDHRSVGMSPATTVIGGAPKSPFASTSQPTLASSAWRAAAMR